MFPHPGSFCPPPAHFIRSLPGAVTDLQQGPIFLSSLFANIYLFLFYFSRPPLCKVVHLPELDWPSPCSRPCRRLYGDDDYGTVAPCGESLEQNGLTDVLTRSRAPVASLLRLVQRRPSSFIGGRVRREAPITDHVHVCTQKHEPRLLELSSPPWNPQDYSSSALTLYRTRVQLCSLLDARIAPFGAAREPSFTPISHYSTSAGLLLKLLSLVARRPSGRARLGRISISRTRGGPVQGELLVTALPQALNTFLLNTIRTQQGSTRARERKWRKLSSVPMTPGRS